MPTVIFPVLARSFRFLPGPIFYFSDEHYLAHVNEVDHGTILRFCPNDYQGLLTSRFRCVYYDAPDDIADADISKNGQLIAHALNYFCGGDALDFPFSISISNSGRGRRVSFSPMTQSTRLNGPSARRYRLTTGTNGADIQKLFTLTKNAVQADSRVEIMMDRFTSALRRERLEDRIIDLAVALEAMLDDTTEISFRLSLYLAYACQQDRATAYDLFKTLYDVRSRIVHGSSHQPRARRAIEDIEGRMGDVIRYAKAAMLYYYTYLNRPPPRDWSKHCLSLVLGSEQPIV